MGHQISSEKTAQLVVELMRVWVRFLMPAMVARAGRVGGLHTGQWHEKTFRHCTYTSATAKQQPPFALPAVH